MPAPAGSTNQSSNISDAEFFNSFGGGAPNQTSAAQPQPDPILDSLFDENDILNSFGGNEKPA